MYNIPVKKRLSPALGSRIDLIVLASAITDNKLSLGNFFFISFSNIFSSGDNVDLASVKNNLHSSHISSSSKTNELLSKLEMVL